MKVGLEARQAAVAAMVQVTEGGRLLSEALRRETSRLAVEDKARAGRLALGALRWAGRSDRVLSPHLRMKPEEPVMNVLRLALFELFEDDAPPHAVVDAAVNLTTDSKSALVNGVLRNVLRREVSWSDLPPPQVPKWLRKRLVSAWGKEAVEAMEVVQTLNTPLDITPKRRGWAEKLGAEALPTGSLRLKAPGQVTALPGYDQGAWWVQDAGAAIAVKAMGPKRGRRVLDLCAAPGGKTMQLAAAGANVVALDISEPRLERLRANLERTGLSAEVVVADALKWTPEAPFDVVVLDAPCSATGTLRRHPDLAYAKDGSGIDVLAHLQALLIDRSLKWLKPGGRLVYCTCSLLPEEGEAQIDAALKRHKTLKPVKPKFDGMDPAWVCDQGLRIRPDHWADLGGIDGFFISVVEKP